MTRPFEKAAHDERTDHQARANFWLGYLIGWFSYVVLGVVLVVVALIGSN